MGVGKCNTKSHSPSAVLNRDESLWAPMRVLRESMIVSLYTGSFWSRIAQAQSWILAVMHGGSEKGGPTGAGSEPTRPFFTSFEMWSAPGTTPFSSPKIATARNLRHGKTALQQ